MKSERGIDPDKLIDGLAAAISVRPELSKERPNSSGWVRFDGLFKIVAGGGALLTALWGVWQYADTAQREAIKPFLEQRLKRCTEASNAAALIAQPAGAKDQVEQQAIFWRLYWGPLAIVENQVVEERMVDFGRLLQTSNYAIQLQAGHEIDSAILSELRQGALRISHACRSMISEDFALRLPPGVDKLARLLESRSGQ
ncbi:MULTISPECIES: hypothetical protein [unclassified Bradyrhizobium]|uniref:hypothetical protein n=1 Tax=unclassified Bradyrhizobium TaxID=2631580 RepID=UPI002915E248|nr:MULTISPECIES: hypothetical protein [unclassified Bradyrhizobium]